MSDFSSYINTPKTIDFISLYDLMNELVGELKRDESGKIINEAYHYSRAAKKLYRDLRNKTPKPRWGVYGGENDPDFADSDNIAIEGMAMIEHMAGWAIRESNAHVQYVLELESAREQGIDESLVHKSYRMGDGQYEGVVGFRAQEIGFDRQEIAVFLGRAYTQTNIRTANEPVDVKRVGKRLSKHLSHLEIVSLWIDTKEHRNVTNHYRETIYQAFRDGDAQYDEKLTKAIKDNHDLKDRYLKAINQAVADGDLKAETSISDSGVRNWDVIPYSPTMLRSVRDDTGVYRGREVYVQHMINRDDFRAWLEKTHQWPVSDDCLLAQWFETEQTEEKGTYQELHKQRLDDFLSGMSQTELNKTAFNIGFELYDAKKKFGDVDWEHWLTLSKWTPEQAVWLLNDIDPIAVRKSQVSLPPSLEKLLQRDGGKNDNAKNEMPPYQWKQFGLEQGISLPQQILDIQESANQQPEPASVKGETAAVKPRKKLKPLEKERNEGLLLIYEMLKFYNVEYLDELPTVRAWGKIVSGGFQSDLIKSISDAKKSITLNGGEKLDKEAFSDKYRRRFK